MHRPLFSSTSPTTPAMQNPLSEIYDRFAETYEANRGQFDMTAILDDFFARLRHIQAGCLLDLGCGAGEPFPRTFLDRGWSVVGVDFSARMLEIGRASGRERVS